MKRVVFLFYLFTAGFDSISQQVWDLDPCFGTNGITTTNLGFSWEPGHCLVLQEDGKIVGAAFSETSDLRDYVVIRYDSTGFLDSSFASNGIFKLSGGAVGSVALQNDGKIVASGTAWSNQWLTSSLALLRLNTSGSLDTAFGTDGIVYTNFGQWTYGGVDVAIQPDEKIVQCGQLRGNDTTKFTIARFYPDGSPDSTFGENGIVIETQPDYGTINDLELQNDGKLVVCGRLRNGSSMDFLLKRYNSNGSIDSTFGVNGTVLTDIGNDDDHASSIHVLPDGKILLTGRSDLHDPERDFRLLKYNSDGSLDLTFGTNGIARADLGYDEISHHLIALQNGKILVTGHIHGVNNYTEVGIVRFNEDGSLDASFGSNGMILTSIGNKDDYYFHGVEQPDSKFLLYGMSDIGQGNQNMDVVISRYTNVICERPKTVSSINPISSLFPNPTNSDIIVESKTRLDYARLMDLSGRTIMTLQQTAGRWQADISDLPVGVYVIEVLTEDGMLGVQKLVKQ